MENYEYDVMKEHNFEEVAHLESLADTELGDVTIEASQNQVCTRNWTRVINRDIAAAEAEKAEALRKVEECEDRLEELRMVSLVNAKRDEREANGFARRVDMVIAERIKVS